MPAAKKKDRAKAEVGIPTSAVAPEPKSARRSRVESKAAAEHPDTILFRRLVVGQHAERTRDWLRSQFAAWWANLVAEIGAVQAELGDEESELALAVGAAEARRMELLFDQVWSELADHGPECVPAFLKVMPAHFSKAEGGK